MEQAWRDLRFAGRVLFRNPGFTAICLLTLAVGIGSCVAIFSVVYAVLLQPLPYPEPDRIMRVWQLNDKGGQGIFSDPNYEDVRRQNQSFEALAEFSWGSTTVSGGSEPVLAPYAVVSDEFFEVLGVKPVMGRPFTAEEQQENGALGLIVSHSFWQRYLQSSPDFSQRKLVLPQGVASIIGVMPEGFSYPGKTELWSSRERYSKNPYRTGHNWHVIGRLKQGVTAESAQQDLSLVARRLKQEYGDETWMEDASVVPLSEQTVGQVRPALLILLGAAGFLLLVACTNVVNLCLARTASRQRELAVRRALGARFVELARQFVAEAGLLSLGGGLLGVLLAAWGVNALVAMGPRNLPRLNEIGLNFPVLFFALATTIVTAAGLGVLTSFRAARGNLQEVLKEGRYAAGSGYAGFRTRTLLVATQMAMTLVLLVGAGLLARSFLRLLDVDPGFRSEGILAMSVPLPRDTDDAAEVRLRRFMTELLERARSIPGMVEAGAVDSLPLKGGFRNGRFLVLTGQEDLNDSELLRRLSGDQERIGYAEYRVASPGYFETMQIPLLKGRFFDGNDRPDTTHVALISESLANSRWPDENPLGKLIEYGNMDGDVRPMTIVGIVGDVRDAGLDADVRPTFYANLLQRPQGASGLAVAMRSPLDPASVSQTVRAIVRDLNPEIPVSFQTIEEIFSEWLSDRRFSLLMLGVFGSTALLLALMGIYGVISYAVAQRRQEIGVRMAMGAQKLHVHLLVLRQAVVLTVVGLGAGLVASLFLTRLLSGFLFGIEPTDPVTFAGVAFLLVLVALFSSYIPARRATQIDPLEAMRVE